MMYVFKVNMLVMVGVFGLAGVFILALFAWTEAKRYARALQAMQRITAAARRERIVISRISSRNHDTDSFRVA